MMTAKIPKVASIKLISKFNLIDCKDNYKNGINKRGKYNN